MRILILMIISVCHFGFIDIAVASEPVETTKVTVSDAKSIPLVRLLALPQEFSGKRVNISGILDSENRGTYLYMNQGAFDHFDGMAGVRVLMPHDQRESVKSFHGTYVVVTGRLDYQDWAYPQQIVIENIERLEPLPKRE